MNQPTVTRFIWIRHAPVKKETGFVPDHDPDARYKAKAAKRLGASMPKKARWVISPLKRTRQTAEQVKQHLLTSEQHPEVEQVEPRIIEQDLGTWAGAKLADVWKELAPLPKHNFSFQHAEIEPPGGERFIDQCARISAYLTSEEIRISRQNDTRTQVMFAHAHTIRAVVAHCFGLPPNIALSIKVDNYSRTILDFLPTRSTTKNESVPVGGNWQLISLNTPADEG